MMMKGAQDDPSSAAVSRAGGGQDFSGAGGDAGASASPQKTRARFGDLLPLPLPERPVNFGFRPGNRRGSQRCARRDRIACRIHDAIAALNETAGHVDTSRWPGAPRNAAQRAACARIQTAVMERPCFQSQVSPKAALSQLLRQGACYESGPGLLAPFARGKVSLPEDQEAACLLEDVLPEPLASKLKNFESEMLLTPEELGATFEASELPGCYHDPVLERSPREWAAFVGDLFKAGVVSFNSRPKVVIGVFFVRKKSGKLRLTIDARRSNRLFRTPPSHPHEQR